MSASKSLMKTFMSSLPEQLAQEFSLDKEAVASMLTTYFESQLGCGKGGRTKTPGVKGTNGKGRLTGYLLFSNENRTRVRDEKGLSPKDASRELGTMWKALSASQQADWNARADKSNSENGLPSKTPVLKTTAVVQAVEPEKKKVVKKVVVKK